MNQATVRPDSPSKVLSDVLRENDWKQTEFAERLGVAPSTLNMILKGKRDLTPRIILQLDAVTGKPARVWKKIADDYEAWAKSPEGKEILEKESVIGDAVPKANKNESYPMVDGRIMESIKKNLITINPFDEDGLQSASYDCRLGIMITKSETHDEPGSVVKLKPRETGYIRSLEAFRLSDWMIGRVGITAVLAAEGIFGAVGLQIDPGYEGLLYGSLCNLSHREYPLIVGETTVLSVEFHRLPEKPNRNFQMLRSKESFPRLPIPGTNK